MFPIFGIILTDKLIFCICKNEYDEIIYIIIINAKIWLYFYELWLKIIYVHCFCIVIMCSTGLTSRGW